MAILRSATGRTRRWAAMLGAAAIAAIVSSCETLARSSGSTNDEEVAQTLIDTEDSFRDMFGLLVTMGFVPLFGAAEFVPCGDDTDLAFVPKVTGQLRTSDGQPSAEVDAERLLGTVEKAGWGYEAPGTTTPGTVVPTESGLEISVDGYHFVLGLDRAPVINNDLTLRLMLHDDGPQVDLTTAGACLRATAEEAEFFEAMGRWYLNNLIPNPPSTTEPLVTSGTAAS